MKAFISFDTADHVGPIDPRIFGGFLEHLGRAVYEGVYDPDSPLSDEQGFRRDVLEALRGLRMPVVRYPGGNFVSDYDWRDGIGPRERRPVRPDYAWKSLEPNSFGVDEFAAWCRKLGCAPMLAVNLGTLGPREAKAQLEYCNLPAGTYWADQRVAHGRRAPHGVKLWCLGNEMDGPWQAGQVPADQYALRARQTAKIMRDLDPTIELVAAGSSARGMAMYMSWDRIVLEQCWDQVEYISAHRYSDNRINNSAHYLAEGVEIDRILEDYAAVLGYVRALKKSDKRVYLAFDEWNAWPGGTPSQGKWTRAPHLLEAVYSLEDALVCGQYLNAFIRRADIVKIACLAQIVNVIAPILTRKNGLLIQSIYHPFALLAHYTAGISLHPRIDSPRYDARDRKEVPALDASASFDAARNTACICLINRDLKRPLEVSLAWSDRRVAKVLGVDVLTGKDLKAVNTWEKPNRIHPVSGRATLAAGQARIKLPAPSMTVLRLQLASC